jgi:hypothetical protein
MQVLGMIVLFAGMMYCAYQARERVQCWWWGVAENGQWAAAWALAGIGCAALMFALWEAARG